MWTPQFLPISLLNREIDDTYLVRIGNVDWIDKGYFGYFADGKWTNDADMPIRVGESRL